MKLNDALFVRLIFFNQGDIECTKDHRVLLHVTQCSLVSQW